MDQDNKLIFEKYMNSENNESRAKIFLKVQYGSRGEIENVAMVNISVDNIKAGVENAKREEIQQYKDDGEQHPGEFEFIEYKTVKDGIHIASYGEEYVVEYIDYNKYKQHSDAILAAFHAEPYDNTAVHNAIADIYGGKPVI